MRFLPELCAPIEASISLPWINRYRPFVAFHFALWGYGCGKISTTNYVIGINFGRRFTDKGRSFWFDLKIPRKREKLKGTT
jgi:hypothetical protein